MEILICQKKLKLLNSYLFKFFNFANFKKFSLEGEEWWLPYTVLYVRLTTYVNVKVLFAIKVSRSGQVSRP